MRSRSTRHNTRSVWRAITRSVTMLALGTMAAMPPGAVRAHGPDNLRICAAFDLHLRTLIEDLGLFDDTDQELLADAGQQLQQANTACRADDMQLAIDLFTSIDLPEPSYALLRHPRFTVTWLRN